MFSLAVILALLVCANAQLDGIGEGNIIYGGGRIVGGKPISITEVPWQVSLRKNGYHTCGASIISADTILSAAHCFPNNPAASLYSIRAGSSDVLSGGQVITLKSYTLHPLYGKDTAMDHDFAILKLRSKLTLGSGVQVIKLVAANEAIKEGSTLLLSGWGTLSQGGVSPQKLQSVTVPTITIEQCRKSYKPLFKITDAMLCAGSKEGGKDSCQGDSGGPAVIGSKLAGVVSWGVGCARKNFPGVYARVAAVRPWIDSQL